MSNDAHAGPWGETEEPLYDVGVPTPTHAERAMTLACRARTGTLCTVAREPKGYPYGSLVTFAIHGGNPILLISALAEHTRNLAADSRSSLLIAENVQADPLANARVTLVGRSTVLVKGDEREAAREAFLAAHPGAGYYAGFGDFSWWRLAVESVRYVGGYGRMSRVPRDEWRAAEPDPLSEDASGLVDLLNADHAATLVECCRGLTRAVDATAATVTSVDRYGFELSVTTGQGRRPLRLGFSRPVSSAAEARDELIALVKQAAGSKGSKGVRS